MDAGQREGRFEVGAGSAPAGPSPSRLPGGLLRALFRRREKAPRRSETLALGNLSVDLGKRRVQVGDRRVDLSAKEFDLLVALMDHAGMVVEEGELLNQVWGASASADHHTLSHHVAALEEKLYDSTARIETFWHVGYKIVAPTPSV